MMKRLIEVIPGIKTGNGIFSALDNPMWSDLFTGPNLDIYFAANYGDKWASKFCSFYEDADTGVISGADLTQMAAAIYELRATEWSKLLVDLTTEYAPLENTDAYEIETISESGSGTDGNTRTLNTSKGINGNGSVSSTATSDIDTTSSDMDSATGANDVYGFGSSTAVHKDETSGSNTRSNTSTNDSTVTSSTMTTNGSTETDTGTVTDAGNNSYSKSYTKNYHKHGNIGVMTAVQLLRDDVDFWKWSFIRQVCEDICNIIALSCY